MQISGEPGSLTEGKSPGCEEANNVQTTRLERQLRGLLEKQGAAVPKGQRCVPTSRGAPAPRSHCSSPWCTPATCLHGHSSLPAGNALVVPSVSQSHACPALTAGFHCTMLFIHCITDHQWVFMGSARFSEADKVNQTSPI